MWEGEGGGIVVLKSVDEEGRSLSLGNTPFHIILRLLLSLSLSLFNFLNFFSPSTILLPCLNPSDFSCSFYIYSCLIPFPFTALRAIDLDMNKKVSFIEYCLYKYKKTLRELFEEKPGDIAALLAKLEEAIAAHQKVLAAREAREQEMRDLATEAEQGAWGDGAFEFELCCFLLICLVLFTTHANSIFTLF